MSINERKPLTRTALGLALAAALAAGSAAAQEGQELVRYLRVGADGAKAYNLADPQAVVVLEVPADSVLAVHGERGGWLDVEVPGGFKVWVWGEYLEPTGESGVLRVTGNDVRMRPLPSSGIESYALEQRLGRGQKLHLIGRKDESVPLERDWVQVWSPPGARAWLASADTAPLEPGASGAALWGSAVTAALAARAPAPGVRPASAPREAAAGGARSAAGPAATQEVAAAMQRAEEVFAAQKRAEDLGGVPDYAAALAAYEAVLALGPDQASAARVGERMKEVQLRSEAFSLRASLEQERELRKQESEAALRRMEEAAQRDPFFGRFDARGWVEKRELPGLEEGLWVLRWGSDDVAELVCFSGRYDLTVFADFEVGIKGRTLRGPIEASAGRSMRPVQIDVSRLEVISGRSAKR